MKSYAIFRIAETIRIILFMSLSIVVFNFYPITALMIILLALLNDLPILAIAYDNTKVSLKPVGATFGTEILATLLAVYGILITPIGWQYALWMWAYALGWFVVDNAAKIIAHRLLRARTAA